MSVFFNGRLIVSPAAVSMVDDSAMLNQNLTVGNTLAIIGRSEGGEPATALRISSPQDALNQLRSGDLLDAVQRAFYPSDQTGSPSTIIAVRVNPATQGAVSLNNAIAAPVIDLVSTDYGLWTNQIKTKVEAGTDEGLRLTTQFGNNYYTQDDVHRNAFSLQYGGSEATSTMSITGTTLILNAPTGTPVATIDLNIFSTIQQLVDRINSTPDFTAAVLDGNGDYPALNGLDYLAAQDVKTALYTVLANLQACVDWFNGQTEGYVNATRHTSAGTPPAVVGWTYLAGGADGTVTNTEWTNCFGALQVEDVQWVVPLSSDASIAAMADTHCQFMSSVGRSERRSIVGTASGTTDAEAITAAKLINSDRTSLCHLGFYDYDANGTLVLFEPYILAAMLGGMLAGVNPGIALTNKTVRVRGWERRLRNPTDTDALILGGVIPVEDTAKGFKVVKGITTWLTNTNYNRVEISTGAAVDFTIRNVRQAVEDIIGQQGNPANLAEVASRAESALRELARPAPMGPGVLVGDANSPAYRNIQASIEGDVVRLEWECSPVIPINYILCVMHSMPFSGSITL